MSNKFTGITSAGSAIPVYDKDAHNALGQKLDTSAFSSISGDFLTEVPDTYLQNTDFTIVDDKITEISGVPLFAGESYTAGDGIDITENTVSVKAGTGLSFESSTTSVNLAAPSSQTGPSSLGYSLLGQLNAEIVAALKEGPITLKPLFAFRVNVADGGVHFAICQKNGYNTPYNQGEWLVAADTVSTATSGTFTMTVGDSYTVDFSTLDERSTTTWSAIEANPTQYYLQMFSYYTSYPISTSVNYAYVNIGSGVPTADVVTVDYSDPTAVKNLVVSNPLPASTPSDSDKVLSVDAQGVPVWGGLPESTVSGFATHEEVESATSGLQPSGDYYSASNPSGFMTELPSSAADVIDAVTANSGTWGGSALPISAGPGIGLSMVDGILVISVTGGE